MDKKTITAKPEQLEPEAAQYLMKLLADHRHRLLHSASQIADGERAITVADLEWAKDSELGRWDTRDQAATAQMHITIANAENRKYEIIAIIMATVLFLIGTTLLCTGALNIQWGMIVTGTIFEFMFLFPFRYVINTRKHNIAIRMLVAHPIRICG